MCDELNEELKRGNDLATALVDHLRDMGGASSAEIPVLDREDEYTVLVLPAWRNRLNVAERNDLLRLSRHTHVAGTTVGQHIDKCAKCGLDLRHVVHSPNAHFSDPAL